MKEARSAAATPPIPEIVAGGNASSTQKKKDAYSLPFRTEKGDFTAIGTETGRTPQLVHKQNAAINKKPNATPTVGAKPAGAQTVVKKPKYDSVLDSAWDHLESMKKPDDDVQMIDAPTLSTTTNQGPTTTGMHDYKLQDRHRRQVSEPHKLHGSLELDERKRLNEEWMDSQARAAAVRASSEEIQKFRHEHNQVTIDLQAPMDKVNEMYRKLGMQKFGCGELSKERSDYRGLALQALERGDLNEL